MGSASVPPRSRDQYVNVNIFQIIVANSHKLPELSLSLDRRDSVKTLRTTRQYKRVGGPSEFTYRDRLCRYSEWMYHIPRPGDEASEFPMMLRGIAHLAPANSPVPVRPSAISRPIVLSAVANFCRMDRTPGSLRANPIRANRAISLFRTHDRVSRPNPDGLCIRAPTKLPRHLRHRRPHPMPLFATEQRRPAPHREWNQRLLTVPKMRDPPTTALRLRVWIQRRCLIRRRCPRAHHVRRPYIAFLWAGIPTHLEHAQVAHIPICVVLRKVHLPHRAPAGVTAAWYGAFGHPPNGPVARSQSEVPIDHRTNPPLEIPKNTHHPPQGPPPASSRPGARVNHH